jgi:protein TonB
LKKLLLIPFIFSASFCFSQAGTEKEQHVKAGFGVPVAQTQPSFPGGPDSLRAFIKRTVHYPVAARNDGARGKVWLSFTVTKEGAIRDSIVLKSVHPDLDREALRVLKEMPDWVPATNNGTAFEGSYILQIEFIPPGQK